MSYPDTTKQQNSFSFLSFFGLFFVCSFFFSNNIQIKTPRKLIKNLKITVKLKSNLSRRKQNKEENNKPDNNGLPKFNFTSSD